MTKEAQVRKMTDTIARFIGFTARQLPDDVIVKLKELREKETGALPKVLYGAMFRNMELAASLSRPSCQDTGLVQFWLRCGTGFPLMNELEGLLRDAVLRATAQTPLRPNVVETFDEYNTGSNVGRGVPCVYWDIVPGWDGCEIWTYLAGGGCALPGCATVLMPGEGYAGVSKFVLERLTEYAPNACPPLLVGVGVASSAETAALLSKKALLRPVGSHSENERAARMERLLEESINALGIGPQGVGGKYTVMGVHIEHAARHPASLGVGLSVSCWSHRRGHLLFDRELNCTAISHSDFNKEAV